MNDQRLPRLKRLSVLLILTLLTIVTATAALANNNRATENVEVFNFGFTMADVTIDAGDTVEWMNTSGFHNVASTDDTTFRCGPGGCDQTGGDGAAGNAPWTSSFTFNTPGTYDYICEIHPGMQGTITVRSTTAVAVSQADADSSGQPILIIAAMLLLSVAAVSARRRHEL